MPVFRYKGFDNQGKPTHGIKDADNERALRTALRREGVLVTEVKANQTAGKNTQTTSSLQNLLDGFLRRIRSIADASPQNIAIFTRQLATLLKAGIPLSDAFAALIDQAERPGLKQVFSDIRLQVNEGKSLAQALSHHPRFFGELFVNMVAVGEASGNLDVILFRLADFLDNQNRVRSKVSSAMMYPILMSVIGVVVMIILMTTVVPKITEMYTENKKALPWNTSLLIAISDIISGYYWILIPAVIGIGYGFVSWKKSKSGRRLWDQFVLRLWVVGSMARMMAISRFASTSATMLKAGLPLLRALEIVEDVLGNVVLTEVVSKARESIREGESIAQPLKKSGQFPPLVCHMIAVGERSGQLETMLENVAAAYSAEVDTKVARLTSLMEPLMIVLMGVSVGFVVFSVLSPMMSMGDTMQ